MSRIYFVQAVDGGPIKMGVTGDRPENRLATMQAHCPVQLRLLGKVRGDIWGEKRLHALVDDHRLHGEWFADCAEVRDLIAAALAAGEVRHDFEPLARVLSEAVKA